MISNIVAIIKVPDEVFFPLYSNILIKEDIHFSSHFALDKDNKCMIIQFLSFPITAWKTILILYQLRFNGFIYHTCTTLNKKNEYKKEKRWREQDLQP